MDCKFSITELPKARPIPSTVPASRTLIRHAWIITATIMFYSSLEKTTPTLPNWDDHPQHLCSPYHLTILKLPKMQLLDLILRLLPPVSRLKRWARKQELNPMVHFESYYNPLFQALLSMEYLAGG